MKMFSKASRRTTNDGINLKFTEFEKQICDGKRFRLKNNYCVSEKKINFCMINWQILEIMYIERGKDIRKKNYKLQNFHIYKF